LGTETVTVQLAGVAPSGPTAVNVYVVVTAGFTVAVPFSAGGGPEYGLIVIRSAFFTDQLRIDGSPGLASVDGLAWQFARLGWLTLTDNEAVFVTDPLVAVRT